MADIVYSGTVLTRSYLPVLTKDEYLQQACEDILGDRHSSFSLCASLIKAETNQDELARLEELIKKRKIELSGGKMILSAGPFITCMITISPDDSFLISEESSYFIYNDNEYDLYVDGEKIISFETIPEDFESLPVK